VALLLLIPFVGIFVMPAAIAGGTLLTRRVLGQPIDLAAARAARPAAQPPVRPTPASRPTSDPFLD
jgi:hypothetical protein